MKIKKHDNPSFDADYRTSMFDVYKVTNEGGEFIADIFAKGGTDPRTIERMALGNEYREMLRTVVDDLCVTVGDAISSSLINLDESDSLTWKLYRGNMESNYHTLLRCLDLLAK